MSPDALREHEERRRADIIVGRRTWLDQALDLIPYILAAVVFVRALLLLVAR